jgi:hypothetical protein
MSSNIQAMLMKASEAMNAATDESLENLAISLLDRGYTQAEVDTLIEGERPRLEMETAQGLFELQRWLIATMADDPPATQTTRLQ